jgi:hypothetical protein
MRSFAASFAAAVVLAAPAAAAQKAPPSILGVLWYQGRTTAVAKLDALTLAPLVQSAVVHGPAALVVRSPDGRRALFSLDEDGATLRVLDLDTMTWSAPFVAPGSSGETAVWTDDDRIVLLAGADPSWISVVDAKTGRQKLVRTLRQTVVAAAPTRRAIVAVLAPVGRIGRARLAVVDERGGVRSIPLRGITAGSKIVSSQPFRMRTRVPGLAVDPDGDRAVVVAASGSLVEVDLATLAPAAHRLAARTLAARRKSIEGTFRTARWFGRFVAVTGYDWDPSAPDRAEPVGLWFVDTRDWSARSVDPDATAAVVAGGHLVAVRDFWNADAQRLEGVEATGYDADARQVFDVFVPGMSWLSGTAGSLLYIAADNLARFEIVDAVTGAVVAPSVTPPQTTSILGDT